MVLESVQAQCTHCTSYMYRLYKLHVQTVQAACTNPISHVCFLIQPFLTHLVNKTSMKKRQRLTACNTFCVAPERLFT